MHEFPQKFAALIAKNEANEDCHSLYCDSNIHGFYDRYEFKYNDFNLPGQDHGECVLSGQPGMESVPALSHDHCGNDDEGGGKQE